MRTARTRSAIRCGSRRRSGRIRQNAHGVQYPVRLRRHGPYRVGEAGFRPFALCDPDCASRRPGHLIALAGQIMTEDDSR